MLLFAATTG